MASVTSHGDQKLTKLNDQIVLVGLELPADALSCRGSQAASELLQAFSDLLILREDRTKVGERGRHLGPNPVKWPVSKCDDKDVKRSKGYINGFAYR